eukprot:767086-Hanusia_phi.AAC.1
MYPPLLYLAYLPYLKYFSPGWGSHAKDKWNYPPEILESVVDTACAGCNNKKGRRGGGVFPCSAVNEVEAGLGKYN